MHVCLRNRPVCPTTNRSGLWWRSSSIMYYALREGVAYWRLTQITAKMLCVMPLRCFERRNELHTYDGVIVRTSKCYWITSFIQSSSCLEIFLINKIKTKQSRETPIYHIPHCQDCLIEIWNFLIWSSHLWNNKRNEIYCFIIWKFWYIALLQFPFPSIFPSFLGLVHAQ